MGNKFLILCLLGFLMEIPSAYAQQRKFFSQGNVSRDSVADDLGTIPAFTIYKDNYLITGTNFSGGKITKYNSDAKFQISLRHRLYKSMLPKKANFFCLIID